MLALAQYIHIFMPLFLPGFTRAAIRHEQKVFEVNTKLADSAASVYAGEPSVQLEESWNQLLQCTNLQSYGRYKPVLPSF